MYFFNIKVKWTKDAHSSLQKEHIKKKKEEKGGTNIKKLIHFYFSPNEFQRCKHKLPIYGGLYQNMKYPSFEAQTIIFNLVEHNYVKSIHIPHHHNIALQSLNSLKKITNFNFKA